MCMYDITLIEYFYLQQNLQSLEEFIVPMEFFLHLELVILQLLQYLIRFSLRIPHRYLIQSRHLISNHPIHPFLKLLRVLLTHCILGKLVRKLVVNIFQQCFLTSLQFLHVHFERKFYPLDPFVQNGLHLGQTSLILTVIEPFLLPLEGFGLKLGDVDGMLALYGLDGWFLLGGLDGDWVRPLSEGRVGMERDIFLAGVLRGSLLQLIDLFQGETSLFLEEGSGIATPETVFSIPLQTGTGETDQVCALSIDIVVLGR